MAVRNYCTLLTYLHSVRYYFVSLVIPCFYPTRFTGVSELCPKQPGWQQGGGEEAI